jgi:hypothetical protein
LTDFDRATFTRATPIKMVRLILGTENYSGINQIDVAADTVRRDSVEIHSMT